VSSLPPGPVTAITAEELTRVLFGSQIDPSDVGLIGRMNRRIDELLNWARRITFALIAAFLALVGNLVVALHIIH
jgi:hypothetical protein